MRPSVPALLVCAFLAVARPAAAEDLSLEWSQPSRNWRSLEFADVNGRPQTLWYNTESKALGGAVPLYQLAPADKDQQQAELTQYEWDRDAKLVLSTGRYILYKATATESAIPGADYTNVWRFGRWPQMTVRSPSLKEPLPLPATPFRALEGPAATADPAKAYGAAPERGEPPAAAKVARRFLPIEHIFGDGQAFEGFKLVPEAGDRVLRAAEEGRNGVVDAYAAEARAQLAGMIYKLRVQIAADGAKSPDSFAAGEDKALLRLLGGAGALDAFYTKLGEAVEKAKKKEDLAPFVKHWRAYLLGELDAYLADAKTLAKPSGPIQDHDGAVAELRRRARSAAAGTIVKMPTGPTAPARTPPVGGPQVAKQPERRELPRSRAMDQPRSADEERRIDDLFK